jgi:hypothetical protein
LRGKSHCRGQPRNGTFFSLTSNSIKYIIALGRAFSIGQLFIDLVGESNDLLAKNFDLGHIYIDPLACFRKSASTNDVMTFYKCAVELLETRAVDS